MWEDVLWWGDLRPSRYISCWASGCRGVKGPLWLILWSWRRGRRTSSWLFSWSSKRKDYSDQISSSLSRNAAQLSPAYSDYQVLSGPEVGLSHGGRGGVAVCGHDSVPSIELSDVGGGSGDLRLFGDTHTLPGQWWWWSGGGRGPYGLDLWSRRERWTSSWLLSLSEF